MKCIICGKPATHGTGNQLEATKHFCAKHNENDLKLRDAAPDLLVTLIDLVNDSVENSSLTTKKILDKARQAIKKAKGE